MRYSKLSQVANVRGFDPHTGFYSCTKREKSYLFMNNTFIEKEEPPLDLSFRDRYLYLGYGSGKFELYSGNVLLKTIEEDTYLLNEQTLYIGIGFLNLKSFELYTNLMSPLDEQPLLKENIPYMLYAEGDTIIAYSNFRGEFKRINTDTESIWEFPFSSLGGTEYEPGKIDGIKNILGIAHGNLWIYTDFGRLIALDVDTGDVLKRISGNPSDKTRSIYEMTLGLGNCFFRATDKNIISVNGFDFQIIDTEKMSIVEKYDFREADPRGIGIYSYVFNPLLQGDYFTFIGEKEREYSGCGWAGIFDYKARKLVWECEIISQEERRTTGNHLIAPQQLYMSGDKLYIKDFLKNLHIFKREE